MSMQQSAERVELEPLSTVKIGASGRGGLRSGCAVSDLGFGFWFMV